MSKFPVAKTTCELFAVRFSSTSYAKKRLKEYKFAEHCIEEFEEQNVRGWGPGGSCVNSAGNAVVLKHKPTNCVVKVHDSRKLHENRKIAYDRLKLLVDRHLNAENSYSAQFERLKREYEDRAKRTAEKRRERMAKNKEIGRTIQNRERNRSNDQEKLCTENNIE